MALGVVGDPALGAVLQELLAAVVSVGKKGVKFKSSLERIESIMNRITPMIEDIENLSRKLDIPQEETDMLTHQLREVQELVRKCGKVRWWNFLLMRPYYAGKLMELEVSLLRFFQIEVQADLSRDSKRMLVKFNEVDSKLDRMATMGGIGRASGFLGWCGVPGVPEFVAGLEEPLKELKALLLKDWEQVVVVLSAPGGCGKTTLAKWLCHDDEIEEIFKDNIFFVTVSKEPNLEVIVGKLLQHLGHSMPDFPTEGDAFHQLEYALKRKGSDPILLVLDDVWSGSENHIRKFKFQISKYKILVTSRSVFHKYHDSTYRLKFLKDQDALDLFHHSAFPNGNSSIPDDLVNEIVRRCGGLPLALELLGGSLCGQSKETWKHTLKQWTKGKSILHSENELLLCLKTSFDALDNVYNKFNNIKDCFRDLALFPEDERIPVTALIDMWVELYNLEEDCEAMVNLRELSNRNMVNLLLPSDDASDTGYYNKHFVAQHDLLRELAIYVNEQNKRLIMDLRANDLPASWIEQRQHPAHSHARLVSVSTGENFSNWYDMQLPLAEVLVLNIRARSYALPQFLEKMDQLKVLIITNYGFCSAEISNLSLLGHLSGLRRIRLEHISLSSLGNSVLQLKNLRKLSLVMCRIDEAFRSYTTQIPDLLPNLAEIMIDYCSDLMAFPAWLCDVVGLQKLSITNCHELIVLHEVFGKLENLQVLRLHACTKLMKLPQSIGSLKKLEVLDITDCISLCELPERVGELCSLSKLHMRGCQGLSELPSSVKDLTQLEDLICDEETSYLWEQHKSSLTNLKLNVLREDANLDWLGDFH